MPTEIVNVTSDEVVRITTPGSGAVSAEGSLWVDYRDTVYAIAEALGCKPLKDDILAALPKPATRDYAADVIVTMHNMCVDFVDALFKIPCPRDTNGDGGCGRKRCPICGEEGELFGAINKFRAKLAAAGSGKDGE